MRVSINRYNPGKVNKVAPSRSKSPFNFNSYCTGEEEGAAALS